MKKIDACDRYMSVKMEIKSLSDELKDLEEILRSEIDVEFRKNGSAVKTYGAYTVSLNEQTRNSVDSQALREDGLYEKYSRPTIATYFKVQKK